MVNPEKGKWVDCDKCDYKATCKIYQINLATNHDGKCIQGCK